MSASKEEGIAELFAAIVAYGAKKGITRINTMPCCWEFEPTPGWFIAVNGHAEKRPLIDKDVMVEPFTAYVEWHGFPAGIITPRGGILAAGSEANEEALLKALGWEGFGPEMKLIEDEA